MHVLLSSVLIDESGKISENRPAMAREDTERWPNVDRGLTEGWPRVDRRLGVGSPQGALGALRWRLGRPSRPLSWQISPAKSATLYLRQMYFFFGRRKVRALFFRPIGATVDLENCCKMTIYERRFVPIQPRTSPIKFDHLAEKSEIQVRYRTLNLSWVPISSAKYLHFHFEIADGQNTKIPSKYQNPFEV